jgi:hypothetical protein
MCAVRNQSMNKDFSSEGVIQRMEHVVELISSSSKSKYSCVSSDIMYISQYQSNTNGIFTISKLEFQ